MATFSFVVRKDDFCYSGDGVRAIISDRRMTEGNETTGGKINGQCRVPHVGAPILPPCAPTVLICGLPAARISDMNFSAGSPGTIATGSPVVLIMGMPAARLTDLAGHGGVIVGPGAPTVLIGGRRRLNRRSRRISAFVQNPL